MSLSSGLGGFVIGGGEHVLNGPGVVTLRVKSGFLNELGGVGSTHPGKVVKLNGPKLVTFSTLQTEDND